MTNGIGGYASSSISGANTRRYHGLLVASLRPPTERTVFVSKVEETILDKQGSRISLSSNQYPGVIHPNGYEWITSFERTPLPMTTFKGTGFHLTKTVCMVYQSNTTVVEYQNIGKQEFKLELDPFYVFRDYHSLFTQDEKFDFYREELTNENYIVYAFFGAPPLFVKCSLSVFNHKTNWYKNFLYYRETERGLPDLEDACSIGVHSLTLQPGQKGHIIFTTEKEMLNHPGENLLELEITRMAKLAKESIAPSSMNLTSSDQQFYQDLAVSGEQFLVKRSSNNGHTIIAGYHWFTDWGRDTMIAIRGLVIARGQKELARDIIRTFLIYMKDGLIPNRFPDQGETPEYNTIDASLWLFIVLYEYYLKFSDKDFISECMARMEEVLTYYRDGTKFRIHMTEEGLVSGGEGLSQLTWMDAKVDDYVVTPRQGCPVEINALWYNALCIYEELRKACKKPDQGWGQLSVKVKSSFRIHFRNEQGYLNDVVIPGKFIDDAFRSNQIYAISLPFSMLTRNEGIHLLQLIKEKLVTPLGLRTLAMDHPDFIPVYVGDQWHRDKAYHQGTVWAFIMGEYLLAFLRMNKYSIESNKQVLEMMRGLQDHFYNSDCIHGISEIFDGGLPGPGKGCIHQAWSVGMLLLVFDALQHK